MSKVLVINSPLFAEKRLEYNEDSLPPHGLGYIATSLQVIGHNVKFVDAVHKNNTIYELLEIISDFKPCIVALNIFTTNYRLVKELVENIEDETIRIVIGGISTRTLYSEIFKWNSPNNIDVVYGDGELIIAALVSDSVVEEPLKQAPFRRYFVVDHHSTYYVKDVSGLILHREFFTNEPSVHPRGFTEASLVTGRGCIYNCTFCAAARSLNKEIFVREMTEEAIVRDIEEIQSLYAHVTHIRILDDLFLKNAQSLEKAYRIFKQFYYKWRAMGHVQTFAHASKEALISLRECGCIELFVGVESGSPRILEKINKTSDIDLIKKSLGSVMTAGIGLKAYFIYGFPSESRDDFLKTYDLALSLRELAKSAGVSFRPSVFQFRPYHGTKIFNELAAKTGKQYELMSVSENRVLSSIIGRNQFNFKSGNYSAEKAELVNEFIQKTMALEISLGEF